MREAKRVINRNFLILCAILFTLNAFLIIKDNHAQKEYAQAYNEMLEYAAKMENETVSCKEAVSLAWKKYFARHKIPFYGNVQDDKDIMRKAAVSARQKLDEQAKYADGFDSLIEEKIDEAERLIKSGFYKNNSFEYVNLWKTRYDLNALKDIEVRLSSGSWLEKLYEYPYASIFSLLLVLVSIYGFFSERKTGLYLCIHAAADGRARLFLRRSAIILMENILINAAFFAESAAIHISIYGGLKYINYAAADSEILMLTAGTLTRLEFTAAMAFMSALAGTCLSIMFWLILSLFSNINIGMFIYIIICAGEYLLYLFIPAKSMFRGFRYINIYYLLFPNKTFEYYNWGYSGNIFSLRASTAGFAIVFGIVLFMINMYMNSKTYYTGKQNIIETAISVIMEAFMRLLGRMPVSCKEIYKILISQKVMIILMLLIYAAGNIQAGIGTFYDASKSYLSGYYEKADGLHYSKELTDIYNQYYEDYKKAVENIDLHSETGREFFYYRKNLIGSIRKNVDYIKRMNERGINAVVLKPYEFEGAFGLEQSSAQKELALLNVLAVLAISSGFISYEKSNGMYNLSMSYYKRKNWLNRKIRINLFLIGLFEITSYAIYYKKIFETFELKNLSVPLKSLPIFENYIFNPSIGGFILINMLYSFILLSAVSLIMCMISFYIKYAYCLLTGMLMVLPQLLYMLGFQVFDKLSIGRYIAFLPCFNEGKISAYDCYGVGISLCAVGVAFYVYIMEDEAMRG